VYPTGIHAVILGGMLIFKSSLSIAWAEGDMQYFASFIVLMICGNVLYFRAAFSNPGYIK
jgi:hypothetical protein